MIACFAVLAGCQQPFSPSMLDADSRASYEVLLKAKEFAPGYVEGGHRDSEAFATLRQSPYAKSAFDSLLAKGTMPAQLYALCYLYRVDPPSFWRQVPRYREMTEDVAYFAGDTGQTFKVREIVDASLRTCTPDAMPMRERAGVIFGTWYERNWRIGYPDIVGGAFPAQCWSHRTEKELEQIYREWAEFFSGEPVPRTCKIQRGPNDLYILEPGEAFKKSLLARSTGNADELLKKILAGPFEVLPASETANLKAFTLPTKKDRNGDSYRVGFAFREGSAKVYVWGVLEPEEDMPDESDGNTSQPSSTSAPF